MGNCLKIGYSKKEEQPTYSEEYLSKYFFMESCTCKYCNKNRNKTLVYYENLI